MKIEQATKETKHNTRNVNNEKRTTRKRNKHTHKDGMKQNSNQIITQMGMETKLKSETKTQTENKKTEITKLN